MLTSPFFLNILSGGNFPIFLYKSLPASSTLKDRTQFVTHIFLKTHFNLSLIEIDPTMNGSDNSLELVLGFCSNGIHEKKTKRK